MKRFYFGIVMINIILLAFIFWRLQIMPCSSINSTMYQELEIYEAKSGSSTKELSAILKSAEMTISENYKKRMEKIGVLGDDSFVFEKDGRVFLVSYYLHTRTRNLNDEKKLAHLEDIPGMKEYLSKLEPFFADTKPIRIKPSNSFWNTICLRTQ